MPFARLDKGTSDGPGRVRSLLVAPVPHAQGLYATWTLPPREMVGRRMLPSRALRLAYRTRSTLAARAILVSLLCIALSVSPLPVAASVVSHDLPAAVARALSGASLQIQPPAAPGVSARDHFDSGGSAARWWNVTDFVTPPSESRGSPLYANDPTSKGVLLAGGYDLSAPPPVIPPLNDTWTYLGGHWQNETRTVSPPPLVGGQMIYDAGAGYDLAFGGTPVGVASSNVSNETWSFDGRNWTNLTGISGQAPPPFLSGEMAYDSTTNSVVLVEHYPQYAASNGLILTWTYSKGRWANVTATAGQPGSGISGGDFVFDATDGYFVYFGGISFSSTSYLALANSTWILQNLTWSAASSAGPEPNPRVDAGMSYDPQLSAVILFGGEENASGGTGWAGRNALTYGNDTWRFSGGSWTNITGGMAGPVPPWQSRMVFDTADGYVIDEATNYRYTWVFGTPPPFVRMTPTLSHLESNESYQIQTETTGGQPPYSYHYRTVPPGCSAASAQVLNCTASGPGNYTASVTVTDAANQTANASIVVEVRPAVTIGLSVSPDVLHVGASAWINATPSYGYPPYNVTFANLPPGCTTPTFTNFVCTPMVAGSYPIQTTVTDSIGASASHGASLIVYDLPSVLGLEVTPGVIDLGDSTTFSATVAGGTPSSLDYVYAGLPDGCASSSTLTLRCMPNGTGSSEVTFTVTDSLGATATSSPVTFRVNPDPRILSLTIAPNVTAESGTVNVSVVIAGGTSPFTLQWSGLPTADCSPQGDSFVCNPTRPGTYSVRVLVTDVQGHTASASGVLTVQPLLTSGQNSAPPIFLPILVVATAVAASVAFAIVLSRRREK